MSYEIVKALHIISVIAWMAGLLYLPRLLSTTRIQASGRSRRKPSR